MRTLIVMLAAVVAAHAAAPNFLPLQSGNEWVFSDGDEQVTIRVGLPLSRDGQVYYHVRGYAQQAIWVRQAADGDLFFIDPETDVERPLTSFRQDFQSGLKFGCDLRGQQESERQEFHAMPGAGPASALVVRYDSVSCTPDTVTEEHYVENLGPVLRRVRAERGETLYRLVHARVGALDFNPTPHRAFQLALEQTHVSRDNPNVPIPIRGHLRLSATPYFPVARLRFPGLNRVEVVLRNSDGQEVFRYSDMQSTLPVGRVVDVGTSWSIPFYFPFADGNGTPLPDGEYRITAWLLTDDAEPPFKAEAVLRVGSTAPAR